ncbi:hypothetical protein OV207_11515 [Corallococcus sp. BB11-1]|nr:hypothetical protein [Corallococcus sp. BB11-1]MCY1032088.1 hypothetical protein [Corallococcus sp. BB11-1]
MAVWLGLMRPAVAWAEGLVERVAVQLFARILLRPGAFASVGLGVDHAR